MSSAKQSRRVSVRRAPLWLSVAALCGLLPAPPALAALEVVPAATRARSASADIAISGFGDGNGIGMGQWGAFGYASKYGWGYQRILAHYYGGTTLGKLPSPEPAVKVRLSELGGPNVYARGLAGRELVASWPGGAPLAADAFGVARGAETELVYAAPSCGGPWREVANTPGPVTLASALPARTASATGRTGSVLVPADIAQSKVQACLVGGGQRTYAGRLVVHWDGDTDNVVGLEAYLDGVVPAESFGAWAHEGGQAALEAQAVAARSYAVAMMAGRGWICDTAACQVYDGVVSHGTDAYRAVSATAGEVLYCDAGSKCGQAGTVALAQYSASTGGYSAGGPFPPVADLGDSVPANPVHSWSLEVSLQELGQCFPVVGALTSVEVDRRNGLGQLGGRVLDITVTGTSTSLRLSGAQFAAILSLPSDWFRLGPVTTPVG